MADRFSYSAYGLHICADFELWPWGEGSFRESSSDEIVVRLSGAKEVFPAFGFGPGRSEAVLEWPGVGSFWITGGAQIVVRPDPKISNAELALVAAGPALALLLEQRGHIVLHGSCVQFNGQAVALLGPSGAGKSTLAATVRDRGGALVSDGMTVVEVIGKEPWALPGPPHLKLWPDAIESLSKSKERARTLPVARQVEKRWIEVRGARATQRIPLRRAFLLEPGARVLTLPLGAAAGLVGLARNYFLSDFGDATTQEFILRRCAPLADTISVCKLQRGSNLGDLSAVVAEICGR